MNAMYYQMIGAAVSLTIGLTGCGGSDSNASANDPTGTGSGQGSLMFETWGEDYIEQQIPEADFADGWSIHYNKFLIVLGGVHVANSQGKQAGAWDEWRLFDLTKGRGSVTNFVGIEAGHWDKVSYSMKPVDAKTELGSTPQQDKDLMSKGGYAVYVDGVASKGTDKKTFHWGFAFGTKYAHCRAEVGGSEVEGVVLSPGATEKVEITVHGDHLFYDDLQSPDAKRRFAPIAAADADSDGEVTLEELAKVKLVSINEGTYGTGSASDINDLRAFVEALSETIGHFRGEGHCSSERM